MVSVVVGLGKTGASCVRYLARRGLPAAVTDSRRDPPGLAELGQLADTLDMRLGGFDLSLLDRASQVLMSPGVSLGEPIAAQARARGIEVLGDIELFARAVCAPVPAPVIGITGTNGKSTVTSLVASMAAAAGRRVLAGGNLGKPALDLLAEPVPDLYVLELSSFQLETTRSLDLIAAVVLNVTSDHMDRYASIEQYARAKQRIFDHAATMVLNVDDPQVLAMRDGAPRAARPSRGWGGRSRGWGALPRSCPAQRPGAGVLDCLHGGGVRSGPRVRLRGGRAGRDDREHVALPAGTRRGGYRCHRVV